MDDRRVTPQDAADVMRVVNDWIASQIEKKYAEGYAKGQEDMRDWASRAVDSHSGRWCTCQGSQTCAELVDSLPLAPLPVKDGGA